MDAVGVEDKTVEALLLPRHLRVFVGLQNNI
jgi:hypothetical protein